MSIKLTSIWAFSIKTDYRSNQNKDKLFPIIRDSHKILKILELEPFIDIK